MDSIQEEKEEENDLIKTFLYITYPKIEDKSYYKVDLSNNVLFLFDPITRTESDKDGIFEMDKIFTSEHNNSYIYEEICSNTIKEALNGESFSFISYGNTISYKLNLLIGDVNDSYTNVDHRGLFPKLLDDLINNINNDKSHRENLSINLSYFCLYNNKIIDLSNFLGKNLSDYKEENFMKKAVEINKKIDNLKNIKKVPTENVKDTLFFINKLFLLLIQLDDESDYHLYSRAHFSIIIYIINNNGEIVSTLTFILLNGSELVDKNIKREKSNKKNNLLASIEVDSQFTYDSIINSLKNNKYINKIKDKEDNKENKSTKDIYDYNEKNNISKLSSVLYDICFSPKKKHIKFRIMGSILPNTGYYDTCKDTLMFLFNCRQANKSKLKSSLNLIGNFRDHEINRKDDIIFDLENKIKIQTNTIIELNKTIDKKNERLFELQKYYKKQVEVLKNFFGYTGNVDILLSDDEYTPEYQEAKKIRQAREDVNYFKKNIKALESKLKKKDDEIEKLKIDETMKLNDKTMVKYYLGVNETKKKKEKDNKNRNDYFNQIQIYEKEISNKNKIINILKKDLENKSNIIMSIPNVIKNHMNKENMSISSEEIIKVIKKKKEVDEKDLAMVQRDNNEEIRIIKSKYNNLLMQKEKEIKENNYQINKLTKDYKTVFSNFEDEIIKLYELFMNLIDYCNRNFLDAFNHKNNIVTLNNKKEEFESYMEECKKQINGYNYPIFFKALNNKNKLVPTLKVDEVKKKKIGYNSQKNIFNKNNNINIKEVMNEAVLNLKDSAPVTMKQINHFINSKSNIINIQYTEDQLDKMAKENLIKNYISINKYICELENYIKKYDEKYDFHPINKNEEIKNKFDDYNKKIKKLTSLLEKEVQKNNKNMVIINTQNKIIEKLQKENVLSNNILKYKNDNSSYKMSLTKSRDKYPLLAHDNLIVNNHHQTNLINYKKSSSQIKCRNYTENNYVSNYQPTSGTSGYSSYAKTIVDNSNNSNSKASLKKRPFSSYQQKVKAIDQ